MLFASGEIKQKNFKFKTESNSKKRVENALEGNLEALQEFRDKVGNLQRLRLVAVLTRSHFTRYKREA